MFDPKESLCNTCHGARDRCALVALVERCRRRRDPRRRLRGIHLRKQNERPDHLARCTSDAAGYWRLAEMNDAMTAEVLSELRDSTSRIRASRRQP
jgi:hypothetical protein